MFCVLGTGETDINETHLNGVRLHKTPTNSGLIPQIAIKAKKNLVNNLMQRVKLKSKKSDLLPAVISTFKYQEVYDIATSCYLNLKFIQIINITFIV